MTDVNGVYFIKGLPAGTYSFFRFQVQSFQTANDDNIVLVLGGVAEVNQTLTVGGGLRQSIPGPNGGRLFRMALGIRF